MKPEQEILIAKAKQTLAAAQLLLTNNFNDIVIPNKREKISRQQTYAMQRFLIPECFVIIQNDYSAVSRAYYCMFYLAEAVLLEKNLVYSSHSTVISSFGREFTKTNILPTELHKILITAQNTRNAGDYGELNAVTAEKTSNQVKNAEQMLIEIEQFLLNLS